MTKQIGDSSSDAGDRGFTWLGAPRDSARGVQLPARYAEDWRAGFVSAVSPGLVAGAVILDVGSGSRPALRRDECPPACYYVGLDLSHEELDRAPDDAYDETIESDLGQYVPSLANRFDLAVSWQVLEHVRSLAASIACLHRYLKPGGRFVALTSGSYSMFGVANRVIPHAWTRGLLNKLTERPADTVFPAYYDQCTYRALVDAFRPWRDVQVIPKYRGASYFRQSRPMQRAYLRYENWAQAGGRVQLATHYLVVAVK
jgi:SAM-dependent methyltransferase